MNVGGALAVVLCLLAVPARAADASDEHVLVVAEDPGSILVTKLRSELAGGGYAVDLFHPVAEMDLPAEAAARHARVVLRVAPGGNSVNVWFAANGRATVRFRERIASTAEGEDPSLLALRAYEVVHGELLPVPAPGPTAAPTPAAHPAAAQSPVHPETPRFALSVGASVLGSPGGVGVIGDAALGLSFFATERWGVEALARIPVLAARVTAPEGSAQIGVAALGGGVSLAFADRGASVRPAIGVGMALEWTHVNGTATPPFVSHSDDLYAPLPYAKLSTSVRLSDHVRLRADLLAGVSLPSQAIAFAGRQVATFGEPLLDGGLALEVLW